VSTAKPMTTSERESRYIKQNGHPWFTPRQEHRLEKQLRRLEHGCTRRTVNRSSGERASKGYKRLYADWLRESYGRWLRTARRQNRRAKLGRYTPGQGR